jgi:hypothetical protein
MKLKVIVHEAEEGGYGVSHVGWALPTKTAGGIESAVT